MLQKIKFVEVLCDTDGAKKFGTVIVMVSAL